MVGSQNGNEHLLNIGNALPIFLFIEAYPIFRINVAFKLPLSCG